MMFKEKNAILVTGGCGFIGSHFIERVIKAYSHIKIFNIDCMTYASSSYVNDKYSTYENYKFFNIDITDQQALKNILLELEFDSIFHFAAESHVDNSIISPSNFLLTNILGTYNLLNLLVNKYKNKCPVIFHHISTDEVFGSLSLHENSFTEHSRFQPNSPYSASKASSDMLVRAWNKTFNIPYIITNCSNNFGPRQHKEKLIPKTIFNAINDLKIPIYGSGENIRDWLYVDDHIEAIINIHNKNKHNDSFNIGGGYEVSNLALVKMIILILEQKYNFKNLEKLISFVKDRQGHDFRYSINSSKLEAEINWRPASNFNQNIELTIDSFMKEFM